MGSSRHWDRSAAICLYRLCEEQGDEAIQFFRIKNLTPGLPRLRLAMTQRRYKVVFPQLKKGCNAASWAMVSS